MTGQRCDNEGRTSNDPFLNKNPGCTSCEMRGGHSEERAKGGADDPRPDDTVESETKKARPDRDERARDHLQWTDCCV